MSMDTFYYLVTAIAVLAAGWHVSAEWRHERRYRRVIAKRLRQLVRDDKGFARGRA